MFWTVVPFVCLLAITSVLCLFYKKSHNSIRIPTLICLMLSYFYVTIAALGWGFVGFKHLTGWTWGWSVAAYFGFWFVPWIAGVAPAKFLWLLTMGGAINFDRVNLTGHGFMTSNGLVATLFWARGETARAAMKDMVRQIKPQLSGGFIKRWMTLHWRWYAPLTGGYACFDKRFAYFFDDTIHNKYEFPITRFIEVGRLAGMATIEINM